MTTRKALRILKDIHLDDEVSREMLVAITKIVWRYECKCELLREVKKFMEAYPI